MTGPVGTTALHGTTAGVADAGASSNTGAVPAPLTLVPLGDPSAAACEGDACALRA